MSSRGAADRGGGDAKPPADLIDWGLLGRSAAVRSLEGLLGGSAEIGGAFTLLEEAVLPHESTSVHRHLGIIEAFYVLEGTYRFELGDQVTEVGPGGVAVVPASAAHRWTVGTQGGRSLLIFSPGGSEGYFKELGEAVRGSGIDQAFRDRTRLLYGIDVLDPLPERD